MPFVLFTLVLTCLLLCICAKVNEGDITFYLFAKSDQTHPINISKNTSTIISNFYHNNTRIVVLIHGWTENRTAEWYFQLTEALLNKNKNNLVIQVDYGPVAKQEYLIAKKDITSTNGIAETIEDFLLALKVDVERIQIIGHSLGGQVAGQVGRQIARTGRKLGTITALDPAGPLFNQEIEANRLNKNDALVVVCLHTDAGGFGFVHDCGTVDFWPNGGRQFNKGCDGESITDKIFCNHHDSYWFYIDALRRDGVYLGHKCASYFYFIIGLCAKTDTVDLGGEITSAHKGNYYLFVKYFIKNGKKNSIV